MLFNYYCRLYQGVFRYVSQFLPWRQPALLEGPDSVLELGNQIASLKIGKVLVVTDQGLKSLGLLEPMLEGFKASGVAYEIYDETVPNPTVMNVEEALLRYKAYKCEGIVAFGGGSSMDCAKGVGARMARPSKSLAQMKGVLKVRHPMPPFFAVPTTSGTGSECTLVTVITDTESHMKFTVSDTQLIPHYAVLDPNLTLGLPGPITAATGMDALTHAVEAYIGENNTRMTRKYARSAVKRVFCFLEKAYTNGGDIEARTQMQKASYHGGLAFTRAYVGSTHAIAHNLGAYYNVPHGLANAVTLPYVLEYYGASVYKALASLSDLVELTGPEVSDEVKAKAFIHTIREMNRRMQIPDYINSLKASDIQVLARRAWKEANPFYPVPEIWTVASYENVLRMMLKENK